MKPFTTRDTRWRTLAQETPPPNAPCLIRLRDGDALHEHQATYTQGRWLIRLRALPALPDDLWRPEDQR